MDVAALAQSLLLCTSLGGTFSTGFEAPDWNAAPWPTMPSDTRSVPGLGGTINFTFSDWTLSTGDSDIPFPGGQGTRALASVGTTPTILIDSVTDPVAVVFKMAARRTEKPPVTAHWELYLDVLDPSTGVIQQTVGPWNNHEKINVPKQCVWARQVAKFDVGPGTYKLRFRLVDTNGAANTGYMALDDLEIYTGSSSAPSNPLPLSQVSNSVSLSYPPAVPLSDELRVQRQWLVDQLDQHALVYHWVYSMPGGEAVASEFTQWFSDRAEDAVSHITTCNPGWSEACITKMYSSGYVVKTRHGTFGADITQGPNPSNTLWTQTVAMSIPQATLRSLATQLDFMLVSHHHHDHAFYPMIGEMYDLGKPTLGASQNDPSDAESLLERYLVVAPSGPYLNAVTAVIDPPAQQIADTAPFAAGPAGGFEVRTFYGRQMMDSAIACGSTLTQFNFPLNYAYHITTPDGLRFLAIGDHRDYLDTSNAACAENDSILTLSPSSQGWWPRLQAAFIGVDIKIGAGPLVNGVWLKRLQAHFGPLIRIHGHEWEMRHNTLSRASSSWTNDPPSKELSVPMTFGEHMHYKAFPIAPFVASTTASSATIDFDTAVPVKSATIHYDRGNGTFLTHAVPYSTATTSHSITVPLGAGAYQFYVTTEVENPGDAALGIAQILRDGPRYGNATETLSLSVP